MRCVAWRGEMLGVRRMVRVPRTNQQYVSNGYLLTQLISACMCKRA